MSEIRETDRGLPVQRLRRLFVYRHTRITRLTHWTNLLCVTVLLMSGLQIFNAHPALVLGAVSAPTPTIRSSRSGPMIRGMARLGVSPKSVQRRSRRPGFLAFPATPAATPWSAAFPDGRRFQAGASLALGRRWHFFFAWLFVANLSIYLAAGMVSGHLRRDLLPGRQQLRPLSLLTGRRQPSPAEISAW